MKDTGYNIRAGSIELARRFGTLDKRQTHPLGLPPVERVDPGRRKASLPRPAPKKRAA